MIADWQACASARSVPKRREPLIFVQRGLLHTKLGRSAQDNWVISGKISAFGVSLG
jgi:hypothetical protein